MVYDDCLVLLRDIGLRLSVLADALRQRDATDSYSLSRAFIDPSVRSGVVCDIIADDLYGLRDRIVEALSDFEDYGDWFQVLAHAESDFRTSDTRKPNRSPAQDSST